MPRLYRTEILDHLGLVAGMYDELGIGDVLDRTTQHTLETRFVTMGHAVKAMVLNGLGFVYQQRYLVPMFFQNKPTQRLVAPGLEAKHLHDDTMGRALDTLDAAGVTELYSLIAVTAAHCLGLTPTVAHLDRTSVHVDGRDNSGGEPDARVITEWRQQSETEAKAFQQLCRTAFACAADAQQALAALTHGWRTITLPSSLIRSTPRYSRRCRPGPGAPPEQVVYPIEGALASSIAAHEALVAQQRCFILATNALDDRALPPLALLEGYQGQHHVARGSRLLKDPRFLASSLYLKNPERIMALLMVMTVGLLVYAALEYRIRKGLTDSQAAFPSQKGQPVQHPTARWVFQDFGGIHLQRMPGEGAFVLNVHDQHRQLLRILGHPYEAFYS